MPLYSSPRHSLQSQRSMAPFFWVVTHHMARNHTGKGVRVSWKIVPAVTECLARAHPSTLPQSLAPPKPSPIHSVDSENRPATGVVRGKLDTPSSLANFASNSSQIAQILFHHRRMLHSWGYLSQGHTQLAQLYKVLPITTCSHTTWSYADRTMQTRGTPIRASARSRTG